jgi:hypothetical protein
MKHPTKKSLDKVYVKKSIIFKIGVRPEIQHEVKNQLIVNPK